MTEQRNNQGGRQDRVGRGLGRGAVYVMLFVGLLALAGPFVWMLLSSFKSETEVRSAPPTWWPEHPTLDNYRDLFTRLDFPTYFLNSVLVAAAVTLGTLAMSSMLLQPDWAGRLTLRSTDPTRLPDVTEIDLEGGHIAVKAADDRKGA